MRDIRQPTPGFVDPALRVLPPLPTPPCLLRSATTAHTDAAGLREQASAGRLTEIARGCFIGRPDGASVWDARRELALARCAAAVATTPSATALTHESAALLHGLWLPRNEPDVWLRVPANPSRCRTKMAAVTIQSDGQRQPSRQVALRKHVTALDASEVEVVGGLPVTSLRRTLLDCAADLPPDESLMVLDAGFRRLCLPDRFNRQCYGVEVEQLRAELLEMLERSPRRRGLRRARAVIALADPFSESPGESRLRLVCARLGLIKPTLQHRWVDPDTMRDYYIDLAWVRWRLAVEFDGLIKYMSPEDLRAEKVREHRLVTGGGWAVERVTWDDLTRPAVLSPRLLRHVPADEIPRRPAVRDLR